MSPDPTDDEPLDGPRPPLGIAAIEVDKLHGRFKYTVDMGDKSRPAETGALFAVSEDRLTLLYGSNGTGKTSLLRLVFHALSSAHNRGHRTAMSQTRFASLLLRLTNGVTIAYTRPPGQLQGTFRAEIQGHKQADSVIWEFGEQDRPTSVAEDQLLLAIGDPWSDQGAEARFVAVLAELGLNPVFLGDSRAVTADALDPDESLRRTREIAAGYQRRIFELDDVIQQQRDRDVTSAIDLVRRYLSQLAFRGTQAGSERVDNVYVGVIGAIVQHSSKGGRPPASLIPALRDRIVELGERARRFHAYGLLPEFPAAALDTLLSTAPVKNGLVLKQVLDPYLDGLHERMDALTPGLEAVASFVDALNSFLETKRVEFYVGTAGIRIVDDETGERLPAAQLSSGEKQIVLLFSDIIALQDQTRLFIIDEPELSLNPQWQRHLMPSLLRVTEASGMQILAATHSIEIMAKYQRRIRRLAPTAASGDTGI